MIIKSSKWKTIRVGHMSNGQEATLQLDVSTGHYRTLIPVHARYNQELYGDKLMPVGK
jgi:hypothetical protein